MGSGTRDVRLSGSGPLDDRGRRRFLRTLGTGAVASAGLAGTTGASETPVVAMGNDYFDPVGLHVDPGTTVRFEVEAGTHSATAYPDRVPPEASPFDSGTISRGGFEYAFEAPGTYDYYCIPHRSVGMVGRVVVGEPGGPAEDSAIPDGAAPESEEIVERGAVAVDEFGDGGARGRRPGMMGPGPGAMDGHGPGWLVLVPAAFLTAVLGAVGGVVYWAARGRETRRPDDATAPQERSTRGEVDDEEVRRREQFREGEREERRG